MRKPLAVELFCGTFGWSRGWLEMGGRVIGYDIEHLPHHGPVPEGANLILQDVHTIDGRRLKDAELILASPPCPEFSYMAMPWKRGRQIAEALRGRGDFPAGYKGSRTVDELTALFRACFRIQAEASAAAGRYIPLVVENVKGAQPWVGKARWLYGSFALWGDVPALMPKPYKARKVPGFRFDGSGGSFQTASVEAQKMGPSPGKVWADRPVSLAAHREKATKNEGGSWFAVAQNTTSGHSKNPVHEAQKTVAHVNKRDGHGHTRHLTNQAEHDAVKHGGDCFSDPTWPGKQGGSGTKQPGIGGPRKNGKGDAWFQDGAARHGSKSSARKAASARIAMIPERLSRHIARYYFPSEQEKAS